MIFIASDMWCIGTWLMPGNKNTKQANIFTDKNSYLYLVMKSKTRNSKPKKTKENPFVKMMRDKARIKEAIQQGIPLSSLKGIEFVHPV